MERLRRLAFERHEVLLTRPLAVEVRIHPGRDEHVTLAFEVPCHSGNLGGPVARQVQHDVGPHRFERAAQLILVAAIERDLARESAVWPLLAACRDRREAPPPAPLACRRTYEPPPAV